MKNGDFYLFENWNPEMFIESDWKEVSKEDKVYKLVAIKALKKAFELIKAGAHFHNLDSLINAFKSSFKILK